MCTLNIGTMCRLYLPAAASIALSNTRTACSWQYLARNGYEPYLVQHTSPLFPQSTAMSVAVTHSNPPSPTACTAPSSSVEGVPYGSRSTASNIFSCCIITIRTSWPWHITLSICAAASGPCAALNALFRFIAPIAFGSRSFATTHPTFSSSRAYRIARKPDAAIPSKMRISRRGGFGRIELGASGASCAEGASFFASFASKRVASMRAACSSCERYICSISSGVRRCGRMGESLGVAHRFPLFRLFLGARTSALACSSARTFWNWRITASEMSRFTTCALL
mmetsp:Transcript_14750/g.63330  ORF Transcript_14750/g.63330 Transcript_14750/m.63330 type:complete len:282 (+) Transcript_14750:978-1823(+)